MIRDATLPATTWAALAAWSTGLAIVLVATPILSRLAWATGYLDQPEARKLHIAATPLLGGVGVAAGTILGASLAYWGLGMGLPREASSWMSGAVIAVLVGLVDDRFGMAPAPKLLFQVFAAWLFLEGGIYPQQLLGPFFGKVLSILWLVGLMNAINFLDNMDGVVSGMSVICAFAFAILLAHWGAPQAALFAFALAGATLAFLRYNFAPARIFLGDAGSLFLGYSLGAMGLISAHGGPGRSGAFATMLVLGYPLFDTTFVVLTRLAEGRKIYVGGRDHTTHRLNRVVGGPRRTALYVYASTAALAISGVVLALHPGLVVGIPLVLGWLIVLIYAGRRLAQVPQG